MHSVNVCRGPRVIGLVYPFEAAAEAIKELSAKNMPKQVMINERMLFSYGHRWCPCTQVRQASESCTTQYCRSVNYLYHGNRKSSCQTCVYGCTGRVNSCTSARLSWAFCSLHHCWQLQLSTAILASRPHACRSTIPSMASQACCNARALHPRTQLSSYPFGP